MGLQVLAYFGMGGEIVVESRMRCEKLRIVGQAGIVSELLRHFRMLVEITAIEAANRSGSRARVGRARAAPLRQFVLFLGVHGRTESRGHRSAHALRVVHETLRAGIVGQKLPITAHRWAGG